jgi:hypothetical protein
MEPNQSKPFRRRGLKVILAIAVVLLALAWWFWPRVDQRVVGKWRCGEWVMQFHEDGLVENFAVFDADNRLGMEVKGVGRFKIVGNRFYILDGTKGLQALAYDLQRLLMPQKHWPLYEGEIVRIDATTLTLKSEEFGDSEMVLHRVQ